MDAATFKIQRIAFSLFAAALLSPVAATAAPTINVSTNTVTISGQTPVSVTVTSSTAPTQIGYSATVSGIQSYQSQADNFLCVNTASPVVNAQVIANLATPTSLTFTVCGSPSPYISTHTATITLNPTDGSGATPAVINVTYTNGSGGTSGTGTVVATPSSIGATVTLGGLTMTTITLTTASAVQVSFTVGSVPSWVSYYQSSGNALLVSSAQPAVLTVTLNGAGQAQAALATTFTINAANNTIGIPITLYNGVAPGGGTITGTGSLTASPGTIPWSYSTANPGSVPTATAINLYSTNGAIGYTATTSSNSSWLQVGLTPTSGGASVSGIIGTNTLYVLPSEALTALAPGVYQGSVTITGSDASVATLVVTATVTGTNSGQLSITPSPISLGAPVNGNTATTTVTVTSQVSGTLTAAVTGAGISVSIPNVNVTANVPATITISGNPSGLANNTYIGTLSVTVAGYTVGAQINFVVGSGSTGGGTSASASPAALSFNYEQNSAMPVSQTQFVYLSGSGNYTVSSSSAWLTTNNLSGSLPATLAVTVNSGGLVSGTYIGAVSIANTSTGVTTTVQVTFVVTGVTTLYANAYPEDLVFSFINGSSSSYQTQSLTIAASDGSAVQINASVANAAAFPWLSISGQGITPATFTVTASSLNTLANGTYVGTIVVTGGINTLNIPVVLVVSNSSVSTGSGSLTLGTSNITLTPAVNGAAVSTILTVSASNVTTYTVGAQGTANNISWLTVSPYGTLTTSANPVLTVTATPYSLPAGSYSGTITLTANGGVSQTVTVTMVVGGTATGGNTVTVTINGSSTSPSLTFMATALNAVLAAQTVTVTSPSGASTVPFSVSSSTSSGGNWISVSTAPSTVYYTPFNIAVTPITTGLAAGTYNGSVIITPSGGTPVTIPVILTIGGTPSVAVSSSSLSFAYQAGAATPGNQSVPVTVTNATTAAFTATAASSPSGWLVVTPTSGSAPGTLTVSVVPTGLSAGTYTGTITVAGASGAGGSSTITVTLAVTAPLPTITKVVNAASFVSGGISPGEVITIGGTSIGPATPVGLTVSGGVVTSTLGGVQVLVNGYLAPLTYVSANQINCIVPYEIAGILNPTILVKFLGQSSNGFSVSAASTAPAIFTANGSGTGPGAILNADNSSNSASAAARGTVVQVFLTGEGQTSPGGSDGKVTVAPYPSPLLPIAVMVGGQPANYTFAGEAPGLVAGVMQLNVVIPTALTTVGNVSLSVAIGPNSTQSGVTVNIK